MRKFNSDFEMLARSIDEENNTLPQLLLNMGVYENDLQELLKTTMLCGLIFDSNGKYNVTDKGNNYLQNMDLERKKYENNKTEMTSKAIEEIRIMAESRGATYTQIKNRLVSLSYPSLVLSQVFFYIKENWVSKKENGCWKYFPPEIK